MGLVRRKWYRFVLCATIIAFLVACYLKLQSLSNSKGKKANLLAVCLSYNAFELVQIKKN